MLVEHRQAFMLSEHCLMKCSESMKAFPCSTSMFCIREKVHKQEKIDEVYLYL